jgi:hypothetical protein
VAGASYPSATTTCTPNDDDGENSIDRHIHGLDPI